MRGKPIEIDSKSSNKELGINLDKIQLSLSQEGFNTKIKVLTGNIKITK